MDNLNTIDHKLNIHDKINRIDKYYQFSDENTNFNTEEMKKWKDALETILYQIDNQFNLLCLSNKTTDIKDYLSTIRCELMDNFVSGDLFRKYKYNSRAGINKTTIGTNFQSVKTNESGLVFYSDYFTLNIVLVDRQNKMFYHVRDPIDECHYIMINLQENEYYPPMSVNSYMYKKEELESYIKDYKEVSKISDIDSQIECNIKNKKNIYKKVIKEQDTKLKISDFKLPDLQGMASSQNISLKTKEGRKKTKAQLFEDIKHLY